MSELSRLTRRAFLRRASLGVAAVGAGAGMPASFAVPRARSGPQRLVVLGRGERGQACLQALDGVAEARVAAVLDHGFDASALREVDGLIVAAPGAAAAPLAAEALTQGKRVFWDASTRDNLSGALAWACAMRPASDQFCLFPPRADAWHGLTKALSDGAVGPARFCCAVQGNLAADSLVHKHEEQVHGLLRAFWPLQPVSWHTLRGADNTSDVGAMDSRMTSLCYADGLRVEITSAVQPLHAEGVVLRGTQGSLVWRGETMSCVNDAGAFRPVLSWAPDAARQAALRAWLRGMPATDPAPCFWTGLAHVLQES